MSTAQEHVPGQDGPRACRAEERAELLDLVNLVFRTSQGKPPSIETDYPHIYRESNLENVRVIRADGGIRASVATLVMPIACGEARLDTVGVNCTTTDPEWQGRGLGGMLMRDIESCARGAGRDFVYLAAGVPEWYRRFGFEDGGCLLTYHLNRGNVGLLPDPSGLEIDSGLEQYVGDLHRIHRDDQLGIVRDEEDALLILARTSPALFVAKRGGNVEAYVLVRESEKLVIEHGGPPQQVAALLRVVFESVDALNEGRSSTRRGADGKVELRSYLSVEANPMQEGLVSLLDGLGLPVSRNAWRMLQLLDPVSILKKLGLPDIEVSARGDDFALRAGQRKESFSRRQLVKVIFGPERISDIAGDRLPVPLYTPTTDHV